MMTDDLDALLAKLTPEERARLAARLGAGDIVGADKIAGDKVGGDKVVEPQGAVNVSDDARINGVAVGVNLGKIIYGRDPQEDERRRLVWYLTALSNKLRRLPLRGLDPKLDEGGEGMLLGRVYIEMAGRFEQEIAHGPAHTLRHYFENEDLTQPIQSRYHPNHAIPSQAVTTISVWESDVPTPTILTVSADHWPVPVGITDKTYFELTRRRLLLEAVRNRLTVLLGNPGSGKSTFLRHLAWALAQRGLDQLNDETALFGWDDAYPSAPSRTATGAGEGEHRQFLPIFLPLRKLAARLAAENISDATVRAALRDGIESYGIQNIEDLLSESLYSGAALLMFDGLDEVPLEATPGVASRITTLQAVHDFAQLYATTHIVVTCRTRAFDEKLSECVGIGPLQLEAPVYGTMPRMRDRASGDVWTSEQLAPFTLGQARHFVPAFYDELVANGQLERAQAEKLGHELIDAIVASPKLRAMAETPLLLTMMALVLYHDGSLPRDRPQLYERILELLLGQWDKVRDGQSLAEAIGVPDWDSERMRPLLDQLSYQAHAKVTSEDGRGRLRRGDLRDGLERFFTQAGLRADQAAAASVRCLDYFEQRSGLLVPDERDSYAFAHLTLQEHCAGRHMLLSPDAAELVMRRRADDRWREPIFLGLGFVQKANPALIDRILSDLIDREENGQSKLVERWQRDLILAAEIGQDRDWNYLRTQRVNVDRLLRDLRRGLVDLLGDTAQPLPVAERVRTGFLLGDLGDPRFPVTLDDWRRELARAQAGDPTGYFCRVEPGIYVIGSADDDPDAGDEEQPQHPVTLDLPFLIARYPITNAQWQEWVEQAGGQASYFARYTDLNHLNQPVVGVTWHMCNDFCTWLSDQLGVTVRLPTEEEWEATARGGDTWRYPWGDEWHNDRAATAEDEETRGTRYTVPVGCYPSGAAPYGALDMAGNVWEWTASVWQSYPDAQKPFTDDDLRVLRGGGQSDSRKRVRCGARNWVNPRDDNDFNGFRVVVAPRLAH